jgi:hypothetical protein
VGAAKGLSAHFTASVLGDRPYRIQGIGSRSCRSDPDGFHPLVAVRASVHGLPPFCLDNGQLELRFQCGIGFSVARRHRSKSAKAECRHRQPKLTDLHDATENISRSNELWALPAHRPFASQSSNHHSPSRRAPWLGPTRWLRLQCR